MSKLNLTELIKSLKNFIEKKFFSLLLFFLNFSIVEAFSRRTNFCQTSFIFFREKIFFEYVNISILLV